jgi:cobalt-zinc-cadmium efflux system membrane fusion protein
VELTPAEEQAVAIETAVARIQPVQRRLEAMGKVLPHPARQAVVSYPVSARVAEVLVSLGDRVTKGQRVLTLHSEEVGVAMSELCRARADLTLAEVNRDRQQQLFDRGVSAKKELLASDATLALVRAQLAGAEKKLTLLGFADEDVRAIGDSHRINPVITLLAPISGKVVVHNVVLGAMVDSSAELLVLVDPSRVVVDAGVFERDIARLAVGQAVDVRVPAYPDERFVGQVGYLGDILDEETRTVTVRTEVPNPRQLLKPGMFANVSIAVGRARDAVTVPSGAVLDDEDGPIVFVRRDGAYVALGVEIGHEWDGVVEIAGGLAAGDVVVTHGGFQLKSKLYRELLDAGLSH